MSAREADAMSDYVHGQVDAIARLVDAAIDDVNRISILGDEMAPNINHARGDKRVTISAIVRLALINDLLRVTETAVLADGRVTSEELQYAYPLVRRCANIYARHRRHYTDFRELAPDGTRDFLKHHHRDTQIFGGASLRTQWLGLDICHRLAANSRDAEALRIYEDVMLRVMDGILSIGGGISPDGARARDQIRGLIAAKMESARALIADTAGDGDPRLAAFTSAGSPEIFHAIAHQHEIARRDPFDVETIHAEARRVFERVLDRLSGAQDYGRILLVLGGSGSGKTHLMRAFRAHVHGNRLGYAGYLQMSSRTESYERYVLVNLLDSLERPYDAPEVESSGLTCLSDALVRATGKLEPGDVSRLRDDELTPKELGALVSRLADQVLYDPRFADFDIDVLRAVLLLQRADPPIKARVLKFLRCEPLNEWDRSAIGDIAPKTHAEDPLRMLEQLGRLIWTTEQRSLVLLVDQLEDIFQMNEQRERFARAMDVMRHVVDHVPSSIAVISCLQDFYTQGRGFLARPVLDRIEHDPEPVRLTSNRSLGEIEALVSKRLAFLYDAAGVRHRDDEPFFPFRRSDLEALTNLRTRDVLEWCRSYREACIASGHLVEPRAVTDDAAALEAAPQLALEQLWNDFRTAHGEPPSQDDEELMKLFAWALEAAGAPGARVKRTGATIELDLASGTRALLGACNDAPQGGRLARQIRELSAAAADRILVLLRCSEFPHGAKAEYGRLLGEVIRRGGKRIVVEDADWRTITAFMEFRAKYSTDPGFSAWAATENPLSRIPAVREIFGMEGTGGAVRVSVTDAGSEAITETPAPAARAPKRKPVSRDRTGAGEVSREASREATLRAGMTRTLTPKPIELTPASLAKHVAFVGSSGTAETAAALNAIEQALLLGVPAVLVDRRGELAAYGTPQFWSAPIEDPARAARRARLQERVDVRVYTPGQASGRPLAIPFIPPGIGALSPQDRAKTARWAAAGLASLMQYGTGQQDSVRLGILAKAIETLEPSLEELIEVLVAEDPALVGALGRLEVKSFKKLAEHLENLGIQHGELFAAGGEALSAESLFEEGPKTRLSIIDLRFLRDTARVDFWVSRLLAEMARFARKKEGSSPLRALLFLGDADVYWPAAGRAATKDPLFDLMKRGRSAGVGVLLATASPGDLDYKHRESIHTWFVGRVAQKTALEKMKPLFNDCSVDFSPRLAAAAPGELFRVEAGEVVELEADHPALDPRPVSEEEVLRASRAEERRE